MCRQRPPHTRVLQLPKISINIELVLDYTGPVGLDLVYDRMREFLGLRDCRI